MTRRKKVNMKVVRIDTNQPGASEMIDIIGRYNSSAVIKTTSQKGKVQFKVKLMRNTSEKGIMVKKVKKFSFGENRGAAKAVHSCAVTIK